MTALQQKLAERVRAGRVAAILASRLVDDQLAQAHEADVVNLLRRAEEQGIALPPFSAWR